MNLVFAGTPEFAVPSLKALIDAGHRVLAVYTQPDRPAGRGRKLAASPVKQFALAHGLEVRQPESLKGPDAAAALASLNPDAMIVIAYGLILPPAILEIPRLGCLNVHASLLPRWRGAAPIQRAIEAGDPVTGVTIMQMEAGLDTGPMLARTEIPIGTIDTAADLHDRLSHSGAELLVRVLGRLERGPVAGEPQDAGQATYAHKLRKDEAQLDWQRDASTLARQVRAFHPWPVAHGQLSGQRLRILEAMNTETDDGQPPGTVIAADPDGILVRCGRGALRISRLQAEGGQALSAREFLNGHPLKRGMRFDS